VAVPAGSSSGVHPLLPLIFLPLLASNRLTVEMPFSGLDLALLLLCVHSVIVPQYLALAGLDRARRGRRPFWNWRPPLLPAGWYRLVAVTGLVFLLIDLAAIPVGLALSSGLFGPRYPDTWVVIEASFWATQVGAQALLTWHAAAVTVLGLRVLRWVGQGAPLPN
jgi:hypothetical protein